MAYIFIDCVFGLGSLGVTLLKIIAGVVLLLRIGRVIGSSSDKSVVSLVITFVRFDHAGSESVRVSCCRLRFVHLDVVVCGVLFFTCSAGSDLERDVVATEEECGVSLSSFEPLSAPCSRRASL